MPAAKDMAANAPPAQDVEVITFGCRLNAYESEIIRQHARAANVTGMVVINSCAVTAEAERQARQAVRRARRQHPDARIVVTGCAAQIAPERFAGMAEVDLVLGNMEKLEAKSFLAPQEGGERIRVNDILSVKDTAGHLIEGLEGRARAFLQVQNGCDHRCTFCIIPYGRGNSRSVPMGEIFSQARKLTANGYGEIVLTGVDITSFGADLPGTPSLGQMVRRLLAHVPELKRLRLSSIDPVEIDEDLWRLIAEEERLMPHLHLSVQAGDDMILKRMKRRHSRADLLAVCARARDLRPDIVFGADIIAGFPTETEEMFVNTLELIGECGLTWLHVFPYSPRPGTPAARMPQVPASLRKERAARLRAAGEAAAARFLDRFIGREIDILMEQEGCGRSRHFAMVRTAQDAPPGTILNTRILRREGSTLIGSEA